MPPPPLPSLAASSVRLHNGVDMPRLGFGTSHNEGGFDRAACLAAIAAGVRLFDTATRYGSEAALGEAVRASGVPRGEFFLTSKLWPADAGDVRGACDASCRRLGVDRLDLYLVHWPGVGDDAARAATWRQMEALYRDGRARAIGVSNFLERHLTPLLATCEIKPMVNQVEFNPFQYPEALQALCDREGIVVEGYCPLAKGKVLTHPGLQRLAREAGRSPAQMMIRWSLERGVVTIPKTRDPRRAADNARVFDFSLSAAAAEEMGGWHEDLRVTWDPTSVP